MTAQHEAAIGRAISLIRESKRIVAFTGAGVSTEAGLPDFRGKGGLWEDERLMELMSASGFRRDPAAFYQAAMQLAPNIRQAKPTATHALLAKLESRGRLAAVITQNIDGLHQAAGSRTVYELHGSFRSGRCIECNVVFEMTEFYDRIERGELKLPRCSKCDSPIKPDVVLFGDLLPVDAWNNAVEAAAKCDLMIVLGSSLVVFPAAELPNTALANGAKLIIVNREETPYDQMADVVVKGELGEFAQRAMTNL
jgi:NAD-dependent deacetylase